MGWSRWWVLAGMCVALGCAQRDTLDGSGGAGGTGTSGPGSGTPPDDDGGGDGGGETDGEPEPDPDPKLDVGAPEPPPEACPIELTGEPIEMFLVDLYEDGVAFNVLDPGDEATDRPADVLMTVHEAPGESHGDYYVRGYRIGAVWPDDIDNDRSRLKLTRNAHSYAGLVPVHDAPTQMAILWAGDPYVLNSYRAFWTSFDSDAWERGAEVEVEHPSGNTVHGLARGKGTGPFGVGYGGQGFLGVWESPIRPDDPEEATYPVSWGVFDPDVNLTLGKHELIGGLPLPGPRASAFWHGDAYYIAVGLQDCDVAHPLCRPRSIVLARVRPASGDAFDDSGLDVIASIPALTPDLDVGRPRVLAHAGTQYMMWSEGRGWYRQEQVHIRVVRLDAGGRPVGVPTVLPEPFEYESWPRFLPSSLGVTVGYQAREDGIGFDTEMVLHHLDFELRPVMDALRIPTREGFHSTAGFAELANPRSILLGWDADPVVLEPEPYSNDEVIVFARLECRE